MSSYIESAQKAEALKKELDASLPMKKEDEDRLWQKFRLEWNYNSNHIEGNTLTYSETKLLIIFGKTSGTHEIRDFDEMRAHDTAVKLVREWALDKDRNLTETDIRALNEIILVRPFWKEAITPDGQQTRRLISIGKYKEEPNSVLLKNGEIFQFASPAETPAKMENLMVDYYQDIKTLHPFQLAAEFHYKFVRIHPFDDGNGRVGRLIMNYILLKAGYPPVIIKSNKKEQYYDALQKADSGDRTAFMEYITDQLIWSLDLNIKAAKGQNIEEDSDLDKEIDLLARFQNSPGKRIKKSATLIQRINKDVYSELLKGLDIYFKKFNKLFTYNSWAYFKEPEKGIPLVPEQSTLDHLLDYFSKLEDSYHDFKAIYRLIHYKDENDFDVEIGIRIHFNDYSFNIEATIGIPYSSSKIGGALMDAISRFSKLDDEDNDNSIRKIVLKLPEIEYDFPVRISQVKDWAKLIGKNTLEYIKREADSKGE